MAKRRTTRQGWGAGSISQSTTDSELFTVRVTLPGGRRVKRTVRGSRRDAQKVLDDLRSELGDGLDPQSWTVGRYLDDWLSRQEHSDASPNTLRTYRAAIAHLSPLSTILLRDLQPRDILDRVLAPMAEAGSSKATIVKTKGLLSQVYDEALMDRIVTWNPVRSITAKRMPKITNKGRPSRAMTEDQLGRFLEATRGHYLETALLTAVALGLRPGELCGLRWQDLPPDLDSKPVTARIEVARIEGGEDGPAFGSPKGASRGKGQSVRTLVIPPTVVEALKRHKVRQAEGRLRAGSLWIDQGLVFPTDTGRFIQGRSLTYYLGKITAKAGLGHWHPHELRHTWATRLAHERAEDGTRVVSDEDISAAAGHSHGSTTTQKVYIHAEEVVGVTTAAVMEAILRRVMDGTAEPGAEVALTGS